MLSLLRNLAPIVARRNLVEQCRPSHKSEASSERFSRQALRRLTASLPTQRSSLPQVRGLVLRPQWDLVQRRCPASVTKQQILHDCLACLIHPSKALTGSRYVAATLAELHRLSARSRLDTTKPDCSDSALVGRQKTSLPLRSATPLLLSSIRRPLRPSDVRHPGKPGVGDAPE